MSNKSTGVFISLAWPDTFVSTSGGPLERFLQLFGAGKDDKFRGGHAALALINRSTGDLEFYDFGRYITPDGKARTRSADTDPEILMKDTRAKFDAEGNLLNEDEILIRLESDPEATHGDGRMLASFCYETDYEKTKAFIHEMIDLGSIPYRVFGGGSNCSRFVADSFKAGTLNSRLNFKFKYPMTITPSPIGNVVNGTSNGKMYEVYKGVINPYPGGRRHTIRELFNNTFGEDKDIQGFTLVGNMLEPPKPDSVPEAAQWLGGRGAGSWFHAVQTSDLEVNQFRVRRYINDGTVMYNRIFHLEDGALNLDEPYQFIHDCHATKTTIVQHERRIEMRYRVPASHLVEAK